MQILIGFLFQFAECQSFASNGERKMMCHPLNNEHSSMWLRKEKLHNLFCQYVVMNKMSTISCRNCVRQAQMCALNVLIDSHNLSSFACCARVFTHFYKHNHFNIRHNNLPSKWNTNRNGFVCFIFFCFCSLLFIYLVGRRNTAIVKK